MENMKIANQVGTEHLKEGVRPIMACIGKGDQIKANELAQQAYNNDSIDYVNFYDDELNLENKRYRNAGAETYVISDISSKDKFSDMYKDCTGVVAAGIDLNDKRNVSFISHQDPQEFLGKKRDSFVKDMSDHLRNLKQRCEEGTIDVAIFGGNYKDSRKLPAGVSLKNNYFASIHLLREIIMNELNFDPIVITTPKLVSGSDKVFYSNDSRRLFVTRPTIETVEGVFHPSDIWNRAEKWDKEHERKNNES